MEEKAIEAYQRALEEFPRQDTMVRAESGPGLLVRRRLGTRPQGIRATGRALARRSAAARAYVRYPAAAGRLDAAGEKLMAVADLSDKAGHGPRRRGPGTCRENMARARGRHGDSRIRRWASRTQHRTTPRPGAPLSAPGSTREGDGTVPPGVATGSAQPRSAPDVGSPAHRRRRRHQTED